MRADHGTDLQLIQAYLQGNPDAGDHLAGRYYDRIFRVCMRYLNSSDDARDATQDVFVKILAEKRIRDYKGTAQFWTWLYRITVNHCLDRLRQRRRRGDEGWFSMDVDEIHPVSFAGPSPEEQVIQGENVSQMLQALGQLPQMFRQAIVLIYLREGDHAESARHLNITTRNLAVRLVRGKKMLSRLLHRGDRVSRVPLSQPVACAPAGR